MYMSLLIFYFIDAGVGMKRVDTLELFYESSDVFFGVTVYYGYTVWSVTYCCSTMYGKNYLCMN